MNVDSKTIEVTDAQIPFADLYLSDLNPRSIVNDDAIELLAANIRKLGLIRLCRKVICFKFLLIYRHRQLVGKERPNP